MPAKNHLNPKQIEKLQKALKEEEKGKYYRKNFDSYYCSMTEKRNLKSLIFWVVQ
jgi:hypothetical protein